MVKYDPIENTEKYKKAMEKILPILKKEFPKDKHYFGECHAYWRRKKELLARHGVQWKTPSEMNPHIMFD